MRGEVHHDRRLHQLMLLEACKEWALKCQGMPSKAEDRTASADSLGRVATSPTDSVSSLHEALTDLTVHDFRSCL